MRYTFVLLLLCSKLTADPLEQYYEEGVNYTITSSLAESPSPLGKGSAIVCALKDKNDFLSIYTEPNPKFREIIKLSKFMLVNMTGEFDKNYEWAKVDSFIIAADNQGREWPELSQKEVSVNGWVNIDYLCNFYDHPNIE